MQPVPKAAYRSDFRENTNFCPQRDSNLGPLAQQASVLPLDHCVFSYGALHVSLSHNFLLRAFPYKAHFNLLSNVNVLAAAHCLKACMIEPPMYAELGGVKCQLTWLPDNLLCRRGYCLSHNEAGCFPLRWLKMLPAENLSAVRRSQKLLACKNMRMEWNE